MKLTQDQIAEIKQFINSRGFTHIEVEMEILDHVASAVETKLEQNPKKSITQAIQEVHASFGVFGFATIEEEKQKYFHVLIKREFFKNIKGYIIGKDLFIGLALLLTIVAFMFLVNLNNLPFFSFVPLIIPLFISLYISYTNYSRFKKWKNKSLMLSTSASLLYIFQPVFGQFIGTIFQDLAETNFNAAVILLSCTLYTLSLSTLSAYKTMNWGYEWTYERYLKYSD